MFFRSQFAVIQPTRPSVTEHDAQIAAQLRKYRTETRWTLKEFAGVVGLTLHQLSAIEYGRTPLRYSIAWRMQEKFPGLRCSWLAWGDGWDGTRWHLFPPPSYPKITNRALLRDVSTMVKRGEFPEPKLTGPVQIKPQTDGDLMFAALEQIKFSLRQWILGVPVEKLDELRRVVISAGDEFLKRFPAAETDVRAARAHALAWAKERSANAIKFAIPAAQENQSLDIYVSSRHSGPAMSKLTKLEILLRRVDAVIAADATERGSLREKLGGVSRQQLNDWLSRRFKPSGEISLLMLDWVSSREAVIQTKGGADAETPATPTTPKEPPDENQKSTSRTVKRSPTAVKKASRK